MREREIMAKASKLRMLVFQTNLDGDVLKPSSIEKPWESLGCSEKCFTAKEKTCKCSCHGAFHGLGNASLHKNGKGRKET